MIDDASELKSAAEAFCQAALDEGIGQGMLNQTKTGECVISFKMSGPYTYGRLPKLAPKGYVVHEDCMVSLADRTEHIVHLKRRKQPCAGISGLFEKVFFAVSVCALVFMVIHDRNRISNFLIKIPYYFGDHYENTLTGCACVVAVAALWLFVKKVSGSSGGKLKNV